ncbi:hypothetical protein K491DRAFT_696127 [Lophiostoma macrostomum CBS 122681]|uniref:Knr4/Smi1-like domain-containing protein n=1 Tax=Lophiostoma macrostomum CBS 122681 TaxID=1314788 RepID=A0A6A6SW44_9PLEO|nr:hypothetical protein K491DRAFT_696127 [Lophiostoma macrostomum CBS 122681]
MVRQTANYLALEFAMLGRVDVAVAIQELLHNRDYIPEGMYDGAGNYWPTLNFAYEAAHLKGPEMDDEEGLIKREKTEVDWVEKLCFQNSPVWSNPEKFKHQKELEEKLKKIFDGGIGTFPEEDVVATLTELSDLCGPGGFQGRAIRARAIDYMMEKGRDKEALKMLDPIVEAIQKSWTNRLYDEVPKLRYAWRLLATGVLRGKLGVDEKSLERKGEDAIAAIDKRLRDGPIRRPLESKTIDELIDIIDKNLYDEEYDREVSAKARATGTGPKPAGRQPQLGLRNLLRKPPATGDEISAVEKSIGMELPDDYKAFLRTSNGFAEHNQIHYIDVIAGTDTLAWKPPLIPEYTLKILPDFESKVGPDIPGVELDQVLNLNAMAGESDYVYLIKPEYMDEARKRLKDCYEKFADEKMKRIIDMSVRNYYGGWEELESLDWGIMRFEKYYSHFVPGFRTYLEDLASTSGTFKWWE